VRTAPDNTPPKDHGILVLDKPRGPTSHDVVAAVRRVLGTRAVGHAGTLDPMASGVLLLGVNDGTKLLQHLTGHDKTYLATLRLGAQTDTLDAQGRVTETCALPERLTLADVASVASGFVGELVQRVPDISAVKIAGERLYARARRGEAVVAPERQVVVHELEILRVELPDIELRVSSSKGFYVRALARDLAQALGNLGHLTSLRRTQSGQFPIADACDGSLLLGDRAAAAALLRERMLPLADALRGCARRTLNAAGVVEVGHGRPVHAAHCLEADMSLPPGQQPIVLVDERGDLRALGRADVDRVFVTRGMVAH
jgi:tRNA pseudouridine55 synthase